jgi:hypothetical protein
MAKQGNKGHNCRSKGFRMGGVTKTIGYWYIVDGVASCVKDGSAFYDYTFTNTYLVVYSFPLAFLSWLLCWISSLVVHSGSRQSRHIVEAHSVPFNFKSMVF